MLHTKVPHIEEIIGEAIKKARQSAQPQLVSVVDRIDYIDPYSFLYAGQSIDQHRLFWKSADEPFTLVGVGSVTMMTSADSDRFTQLQEEWNSLVDQAITYDEYGEKGTGIVSIGGFPFDPDEENARPWKSYDESRLTVPAFLLTNRGYQSYLTSNFMVQPEDHPKQIVREWKDQKDQLLSQQDFQLQLPVRTCEKEIDPEQWKESVLQATVDIKRGVLEKVVLARELQVSFEEPVQLEAVLKALAETQTNSYIFSFESNGEHFIGATPERLAKLEQQRLISTCLAGTIPRGQTEEEDRNLGQELLYDPKNRQEHQFVVEMIKEAVEACSSNVEVPKTPVIYPLRNMQHLYTPVMATLDTGYTLLDVIERLHPTPALGGLPQKKSVEYIREYESLNRGWYAGPVGWMDDRNNGEFAVAIRSALLQGDKASLFAGCGVVEDSDPIAEYKETAVKLQPMLSVLGGC